MKKLVAIVLILIGTQGTVMAQGDHPEATITERTFNLQRDQISCRHTVYLRRNEKMIIELNNKHDYSMLKSLDSILIAFRKDSRFYEDSILPANSVRIDYAVNASNNHKKMRFVQHRTDGDVYIQQGQETSKLKLEQDTIRIILLRPGSKSESIQLHKPAVQLTFCLNNYANIDELIQDKAMLAHTLDTLAKTAEGTHWTNITHAEGNSTIQYYPFEIGTPLKKVYVLSTDNTKDWHSTLMGTNLNVGVGFIKNVFVPSISGSIVVAFPKKYDIYSSKPIPSRNYIGFSFDDYFFFDKNTAGTLTINYNTFLNAEFGFYTYHTKNEPRQTSFSIGYLAISKGNYFDAGTFKLSSCREIVPNIIVGGDLFIHGFFKQAIPGLTVKVKF